MIRKYFRKFLKGVWLGSPSGRTSLANSTLRQVGLALFGAGSLFLLLSLVVVCRRFDAFDAKQYAQELRRVSAVLKRDCDMAQGFVVDYATWDEAYYFVQNRNPDFIATNFTPAALASMHLNGMGIVNQSGRVMAAIAWRADDKLEPLPAPLLDWITQEATRGAEKASAYMVWLAGRPVLIAAAPITDTQGKRRTQARLYMIRYLDGTYQELIQEITGVSFAFQKHSLGQSDVQVEHWGNTWSAQQEIAPGLVVEVGGTTRLGWERQMTMLLLVGNGLLLGMVSLVGTAWVLRKRVLGRLVLFADRAVMVQKTYDHQVRWPVTGRDELDELATALNQLQATVAQRQMELHQVAYTDSLTGLPNRRSLLESLTQIIQDSPAGVVYVLMLLDLDHFKKVNDTRGHLQGDELLIEVGNRLLQFVADEGRVARLGGDEFVVVLPQIAQDEKTAIDRAEQAAQAILDALMQPSNYIYREQGITASIGITLFDNTVANIHDLLRQADLAMYHAKAQGRNGFYTFHPELQISAQQRVDLEYDLAQAIERGQLELYYQPQVTYDYRLIGLEALVRWRHPQRGLVSPAEFIPLAEETGLIVPLGDWVLTTACAQLADWTDQPEWAGVHIAVNISAKQLHQPDFAPKVLTILKQTGADPRRLTLELTESVTLNDPEGVVQKIKTLTKLGIRFSLDDFGVGYSALTYLKRLPLHQIKIDRCFVRHLHQNANDQGIAQMMIALGETLGLDVVAEGVEQEEHRAFLAAHGCCVYQGYLFAPPMPLRELTPWRQRQTLLPVAVEPTDTPVLAS